jgi:arsenate reductase
MAEAYYNYFTKSNNSNSGGIDPLTPAKYLHPTKEVIQVMAEDGIDVSKNKVKTVNETMIDVADRIFVLCGKDECPEYLRKSQKAIFWTINDPYQLNNDQTRSVRDQIKKRVKEIIL